MIVHDVFTPERLSYREVPVASFHAAAGFPSPADDFLEKRLDINDYLIDNPAATFFVRVKGDSMQGAGIFDSDILVVDRSRTPLPGHVVVAVLDGEMVVKRLVQREGQGWLAPENPRYPAIPIDEGREVSVWGVVLHVVHSL